MTAHDAGAISEHLALILGEPADPEVAEGWVFLAFGYEPTVTDTGTVKYDRWTEDTYRWPAQADDVVAAAATADTDVFVTPALSWNPHRLSAQRRPLPAAWCWCDVDKPTADTQARAELLVAGGAVRVASGSAPERFHLYVPLDEPADPAEVEHLNRRLAGWLGGDPAVGGHGGYLRLAGTLNRKPTARGDAPVPVVLTLGNGGTFSVADLDELLPDAPPPASPDVEVPDPEEVPDDEALPVEVVELLAEVVVSGMDRSARTHALVGACFRGGLTVGQAVELAGRHAPTLDKYGPRLAREVGRCWAKVRADAERDAAEVDALTGKPAGGKRGPESVATQLVRLAAERYRFAQDDAGRAFAVALDGPAIAVPLEGGRGALRDELARRYFAEHGKAASKSALTDAVAVLAGMAASAPAERLALRAAVLGPDLVVIDLGRPDGRAVLVRPDGWEVVDRAPVTFRRTELTGPLPDPVRGDGSAALRRLVNVPADVVPLLLGWLVATFLTDVPRPILAVFGEQGTGKTSTVRVLVVIVDPSPVPLRAAPSNLEGWVVAAAGSSVVGLDNLSTIPPWLSDALCRAATGEGLVRRRLYTDDALSVTTMRRAVVLTTIDAGALRGDLAERLLALELEPIDPAGRRTDADLAADLERDHPAVLAAVLDALAGVLAHLPEVPDDVELPRMADFGRVLAALDLWAGTDALARYRDGLDRVAVDVVEGDPVAAALRAVALTGDGFDGTAAELADALRPHRPSPEAPWPTTPRAVAGVVRRCAPALRATGVAVTTSRTKTHRRIVLRASGDGGDARDGRPSVSPQGFREEERAEDEKPHDPRSLRPSPASPPSPADGYCARCRTGYLGFFGELCDTCADAEEVPA